ncbi:MAG: DUF4129 domain-containing protein [Chloroflexota bacterium]
MNQPSDVSSRSPDPRTDESARGSKWFLGWARYVKPFLLLFGILALILLAAGLHDVHFAEPRQFRSAEAENISFSVASLVEELASIPRWKQLLFWVGVYLIVLIATTILSPELRKRLLRAVFRLAVLTLVILYVVQNRERFGLMNLEPLALGENQPTTPVLTLPPPVFTAPDIPPALTYLLSLAVLLLTFGLLWLFGRGFLFRRIRPDRDSSLEEIAEAARSSLYDLSLGRDWEDAILQCYARMTEVVSRRRGFHRAVDVTPSEFAAHLEQSGLPSQAVRRLTRLFEAVRYGARTSNPRESAEAADCLREVLHHCGEAA